MTDSPDIEKLEREFKEKREALIYARLRDKSITLAQLIASLEILPSDTRVILRDYPDLYPVQSVSSLPIVFSPETGFLIFTRGNLWGLPAGSKYLTAPDEQP